MTYGAVTKIVDGMLTKCVAGVMEQLAPVKRALEA